MLLAYFVLPCVLNCVPIVNKVSEDYANLEYKCDVRVIHGFYKRQKLLGMYQDIGTGYRFYSRHAAHTLVILDILQHSDPDDGLEKCKEHFKHCRKAILPCGSAENKWL